MIATLRDVTYHYPRAAAPALNHVSLDVPEGAFGLLAGPSAGGKSTLLRVFNGLVPQFHGGRFSGSAVVAGVDPVHTPARRMANLAGMVFQEPEAQAIADTVEDELAFGMEQQGVEPATMRRRIDTLLGELGIDHLRHRRLATLSGGERQRVAIAAVLALEPRLLLLDEPASQLDPAGAAAVLGSIERLHRTRGLTVLIAEHRLERLLPVASHVYAVESGRVTTLTPREAASHLEAVPAVCELARRLNLSPIPLTVEEARPDLPAISVQSTIDNRQSTIPADNRQSTIECRSLSVAYSELLALDAVSLTLHAGEVVALVGPNGSGKSTLFRAIAGLVRPVSGEVRFDGRPAPATVQERTSRTGLVPQDPAIALYRDTVREEIADTLRSRHIPGPPPLADWNIDALAERHPRDISVGQQQRVAIAAMLAHSPRTWLLDEPTRGADHNAKHWLSGRLRAHAAAGGAAIVATHDIESAAHYATRVIGLDHGRIAFDLPAREAFGTHGPHPTQVAQMIPGALTPEEVSL